MTSEFSRIVDLRQITAAPLTLVATPEERAALVRRFDLVSIERMEATVTLQADGDIVTANGQLTAAWVQPCAISGEDLAQSAEVPLTLRFVPATGAQAPEVEIELSDSDCDDIDYSGTDFDLGEAVAQSLGLAIDPFACGPHADAARKAAGIVSEAAAGPFAGLAGLKLND